MDDLQRLNKLLRRVTADEDLMPFHLCLYICLCREWIANQCKNPFSVSRSRLMRMSRIRSRTTYHKIISELKTKHYISYKPSYHPVKASRVSLIVE